MSEWMTAIEKAVRAWAKAGGGKSTFETVLVHVAISDAWRAGVPTAEAMEYAKRRIAHYRGITPSREHRSCA